MTSPSSQRPFQQNLPHSIQEKISLVSTFEELIGSLKGQLKNAEDEYARLQADIEPYRVPEYVETPTAPSRRSLAVPMRSCTSFFKNISFHDIALSGDYSSSASDGNQSLRRVQVFGPRYRSTKDSTYFGMAEGPDYSPFYRHA
jgi:hypothetical protein